MELQLQNTMRQSKLLAAFMMMAFMLGLPVSAKAAVAGSTPGQFSVTPTGGANYSIPIAVPPGTAGMAPNLALSYNSQGGNGLLGMGWALSGLSAITRCPKTFVQDGVKEGISYTNADKYCLDGQRLVPVTPATISAPCASSIEYRTEREGFIRVVSCGAVGTTGPAYFKAWTKAGQIIEFGNTTEPPPDAQGRIIDARIEAKDKTAVRVWAQNRVSDAKGNYLTISYVEDKTNGQYYPSQIDYTGNTAAGLTTPYNSVRFTYVTRPDIVPMYDAGSLMKTTVRLTNVQTWAKVNGTDTMVKDYRLTYDPTITSTNRSRLTSLTECDGAVTAVCLLSTTLLWQGNAETFLNVQNWGTGGGTGYWSGYATTSSQSFHFTDDFNGDGKADFMYWSSGWNMLLGTGSDFAPVQNWGAGGGTGYWPGYATTSTQSFHFPGDFNGDGKADFMYWSSGWKMLLSTGSGFAPVQDWGAGAGLDMAGFTRYPIVAAYSVI